MKENGEWRQQVAWTGEASERLWKLSEHLWKQSKGGGWRKGVWPKVRVYQDNIGLKTKSMGNSGFRPGSKIQDGVGCDFSSEHQGLSYLLPSSRIQ